MAMQYSLNGRDMKAVYGVVISNGSETFLQFPKRKGSLSKNWPEKDGDDIDLAEPTFEARQFTLKCCLIAANRVDFKNKYYGLFTELKSQGTYQLYITDLDQNFVIYYKEQLNAKKITKIDRDHVGMLFDLVFGETNPADNMEEVYLVDENDNFIIG